MLNIFITSSILIIIIITITISNIIINIIIIVIIIITLIICIYKLAPLLEQGSSICYFCEPVATVKLEGQK